MIMVMSAVWIAKRITACRKSGSVMFEMNGPTPLAKACKTAG